MNRKMVMLNGELVGWVDAVLQMDPKVTKPLEALYPCTEQAFMDAYAQAHEKLHGKPFEVR